MNVLVNGADRKYYTPKTAGANTGLEAGAQASTYRRAQLFSAMVYLRVGAAGCWLHVFDAAATPATGDAPVAIQYVQPGTTGWIDFGSGGVPMDSGIYVGLSSTEALFTAVATNDGKFTVTYRE